MHRALLLAGLLTLPLLLAACTFPQPEDPFEGRLEPAFRGIRGLTPEDARSHPVALHITPDGKTAYVALAGTIARPDDRIAVIDLETGTLDHHIPVGPRPLAFAQDPQSPDRVLVAHPYVDAISILDTENGILAGTLPAPYYIEDIAFSPDGTQLVAVDRDRDRLVVYNVTRDDPGMRLEEHRTLATGPNPEKVVFVPPPEGADWSAGRLVAATDRHGASVTLGDLETGDTRRLDTSGAPLAIAARDGLLFVAGYGPGNGTGARADDNDTIDAGTAGVENSLLVLDVRQGPELFTAAGGNITGHRFRSDTGHPDGGHGRLSILGGASPRALVFEDRPLEDAQNDTATLWIAYHGTDQVQSLRYTAPGDAELSADLLTTRSRVIGDRLSHRPPEMALTPGRLTDTVHGVYETEPGPRAVALEGDLLLIVAEFPERLHIIDLDDCPGPSAPNSPCSATTIGVVDDPRPYPDGIFEEGERLFYSALPSADQDRSCASCHIDGLSTGGTWSLPHRNGTEMRIPRLDQVADNAPWLYDGTAEIPEDYLDAAGGDLLRADPSDPHNLATRTTQPGDDDEDPRFPGLRARLSPLTPNATTAEDYIRRTFAYAMGEERMLPAPPRITDEAAAPGSRLFENPRAECASCHMEGTSANVLTGEQADRVPKPPGATQIKAPALGGLWDRQNVGFLWDGRAETIHQALLPEGSDCLPSGADGLERPWHGDLQDRTCQSIDQLATYLLAFEARR